MQVFFFVHSGGNGGGSTAGTNFVLDSGPAENFSVSRSSNVALAAMLRWQQHTAQTAALVRVATVSISHFWLQHGTMQGVVNSWRIGASKEIQWTTMTGSALSNFWPSSYPLFPFFLLALVSDVGSLRLFGVETQDAEALE